MTDKELLELAAKAAGMVAEYHHGSMFVVFDSEEEPEAMYWNPLIDSGEALRLAVKLGLHISQQLSYVAVMQPHGGAGSHRLQWTEQYNDDPYAATRRTIVRAAAAIGEQMT